ncbi:hypothetical protein ACFY83_24265 [Streptomyces althioticus]|uniref:hypothetical protein n=1 Tax=Streptomyces althioticus TaxID=83380 RepID=UPI0036F161C0
MNRTTVSQHRLLYLAGVAAASALTAAMGVSLSDYGVRTTLVVACCLSSLAAYAGVWGRVVAALSTTTHACTKPGCDFRVRLTCVDAAENRRWQEIAANHPHRG